MGLQIEGGFIAVTVPNLVDKVYRLIPQFLSTYPFDYII